MTDQELKDLVASLAISQKESGRQIEATSLQMRETDRQMQETDRKMQETDRKMRETDRQIRELKKQIGGLGNKFGGFTEGLAWPSMSRVLSRRFGAEFVAPRVKRSRGKENIELDALGYRNSDTNAAWVVEVKSRLGDGDLDSFREKLRRFSDMFPEHADKQVFGILSAVDISGEMARKVLAEGIYLARVHEDLFELAVPKGFVARDWHHD